MIHITINGRPAEIAEGRTILEACRENGVNIPTLCYHPALEPYGACRLCMVEVISRPRPARLAASCVTPCEEGQEIHTDTQVVQRSRRMTAELLLAEGYNRPAILALAHELGVKDVRFRLPEENPCILCGLCVRTCKEIVGVGAIGMIHRGIAKTVSPPFEMVSASCIGCGTCVLACPTGAISLSKVTGYRTAHPPKADFERDYCQICSELDLSPAFSEELAALAVRKPNPAPAVGSH